MKGEVFHQDGYFWHKPCARLDEFPRRGKMVPSTIMSDAAEVRYKCEVCGFTFVEKRQEERKKRRGGRQRVTIFEWMVSPLGKMFLAGLLVYASLDSIFNRRIGWGVFTGVVAVWNFVSAMGWI